MELPTHNSTEERTGGLLTEMDVPLIAPEKISLHTKGNEFLIMDTEHGRWVKTNDVGRQIIELFQKGSHSLDVVEHLAGKYGLEPGMMGTMVGPFITGLAEIGVLTPQGYRQEESPAKGSPQGMLFPENVKLWIHVTNHCNIACPFCFQKSGVAAPGELGLDDWIYIFNQLKGETNAWVAVSGGEPFSCVHLEQILQACREIVRPEGITLLSNGSADPALYKKMAPLVDMLQISIDGVTAATHDRIRGQGTFDKAMKTIHELKESGFKGLWLSFTPTAWNVADLPKMIPFAIQLGAAGLHVNELMPAGRGNGSYDSLVVPRLEMGKQIENLFDEYRHVIGWDRESKSPTPRLMLNVTGDYSRRVAKSAKRTGCGLGITTISIDPTGNVYPCPSLHVPEFRCGNIRDEPFADIYERSGKQFSAVTLPDLPGCTACDIKHICGGGCRARAFYLNGKIDAVDPLCDDIYDNIIQRCWQLEPYVVRSDEGFRIAAARTEPGAG